MRFTVIEKPVEACEIVIVFSLSRVKVKLPLFSNRLFLFQTMSSRVGTSFSPPFLFCINFIAKAILVSSVMLICLIQGKSLPSFL